MIENCEIIVSCSSHMKRIVDDVLTISKLDGNLIVITPIEVQPVAEIEKVIRLFQAEAENAGVELKGLQIKRRFKDLNVDVVKMDPVRLSQILVNLVSNAIKFTQFEDLRQVEIILDASFEDPSTELNGCRFVRRQEGATSMKSDPDPTRKEEELYIIVSIKDTGKGLSPDEAEALFIRFSQGSPRTHIQYGGNGLGLFISRKIVELQGGAIGFSSNTDQGSIFTFYIKVCRSISITGVYPSLPVRTNPKSLGSNNNVELDEQHKLKTTSHEHVYVLVVEGMYLHLMFR